MPEGTFHYNAQLFVDELVVVRKALGLEHFHLLGQSWGTILMLLYLLQEKPEGIASIVVSSGLPSTKLWVKEVGKLKSFMPKEMQEALDEADRTGNYDTPEAKAAADEFYRRHVCSLPEYPDFVMKSFAEPGPAYVEMQGVSEFVFTGNLLSYDVEDQLKDVKQPALVISGEFDECTPLVAKTFYDKLANAEDWLLIENGTHLCNVEFPEIYNKAVEEFIERHE